MSIQVPAAVVFGFEDPRTLGGAFPLFGRTGLDINQIPKKHRDLLNDIKAMNQPNPDGSVGSLVSGTWVITQVKVSLTRFWACSTASIQLVCPLLVPGDKLPLAPVYPEMPLSIFLGYDENLYGLLSKAAKIDPVFLGYIDTITYKLTPKRVFCTISLRDSVRFLVDNKITRLYTGSDAVTESGGGVVISGSRTEIIKSLIMDGCGSYGEPDADGKPKPEDRVFTEARLQDREGNWLISDSGRKDVLQNTTQAALMSSNNGTTEVSNEKQAYNVMNRFPIEVIKHISSLETRPMEFYADEFGKIHWQPRSSDTSKPPKDYWFRQPITIDPAHTSGVQPILTGSMEWSTLGTMTEFVVVNPLAKEGAMIAIRGRMKPKAVFGFDMASRTRFVFDDTLVESDATGVGNTSRDFLMAMLMLWGKDVRAGSIEMVGDAQLKPSNTIRIWNMALYPPPENAFRVESVVHSFTASGPRKGFRTSALFAEPEIKPQVNRDWVETPFTLITASSVGQPVTVPENTPTAPQSTGAVVAAGTLYFLVYIISEQPARLLEDAEMNTLKTHLAAYGVATHERNDLQAATGKGHSVSVVPKATVPPALPVTAAVILSGTTSQTTGIKGLVFQPLPTLVKAPAKPPVTPAP